MWCLNKLVLDIFKGTQFTSKISSYLINLLPTQVIPMLPTKEKSQAVIIRTQIQKLLPQAIENGDDLLVQLLKIALAECEAICQRANELDAPRLSEEAKILRDRLLADFKERDVTISARWMNLPPRERILLRMCYASILRSAKREKSISISRQLH